MASSEDRPLLLDVNALLALGWPNHQFHRAVVERLERRPAPAWATCALTQLGFVRLSANPAVVGIRRTPAQALDVLFRLAGDRWHTYLETLPALRRVEDAFTHLLGHRQVTDAYLLAVAASHDAILATLDRRFAVHDPARARVEVIAT